MQGRKRLATAVLLVGLLLPAAPAGADDDVLTANAIASDDVLAANAIAPLPPATARETLARAEASLDAGRYQEALDALDAGPIPPEAVDLVATRRAELALDVGNVGRARAELAAPALQAATNRM